MIPWRKRLRFRTYNLGKLVKYGILAHMMCEATTGYIGYMEIYTAEGRKLARDHIFYPGTLPRPMAPSLPG
jgi:hypothetical protein